jgi:predicted O-methyltransferase YrrM
MNDNFNFNQFIEKYEEYLPLGDSRRTFYEHVCNHLINLGRPVLVVETGTMWSKQGASTLFFADFIKNWTGGRIITIDISEEHINLCKENTKEFTDVITYIVSDSIEYLSLIGPSLGKKMIISI